MARNTMQRRVNSTTITYQLVEVQDGQGTLSEPKTVELQGKLREHQVHSKLKDLEADKFIVTNVEHNSKLYEMEIAEFIKYATVKEENSEKDGK